MWLDTLSKEVMVVVIDITVVVDVDVVDGLCLFVMHGTRP
jgi:hypothetical protein